MENMREAWTSAISEVTASRLTACLLSSPNRQLTNQQQTSNEPLIAWNREQRNTGRVDPDVPARANHP